MHRAQLQPIALAHPTLGQAEPTIYMTKRTNRYSTTPACRKMRKICTHRSENRSRDVSLRVAGGWVGGSRLFRAPCGRFTNFPHTSRRHQTGPQSRLHWARFFGSGNWVQSGASGAHCAGPHCAKTHDFSYNYGGFVCVCWPFRYVGVCVRKRVCIIYKRASI